MQARDVMVAPVITIQPNSTIREAADLLWRRHISGAPVVDDHGKVIGIISEGDLIYRSELRTERSRPYWLLQVAGNEALAKQYVKSHAQHVSDVMTQSVVTAAPDAPLGDIAALMEKNFIKRVPIVENDQLVGIVTRANLVQAVASAPRGLDYIPSDSTIRAKLLLELNKQPWADESRLNVIVRDGIVDLWGTAGSDAEKQAIRVAAESVPGVCAVNSHLRVRPAELPVMIVPPDIAVR